MSITDPEDVVVITGRNPMYVTANGLPMYGDTLISDNESLSLFLRSPDIFRDHISIMTLDMYVVVERSPVIPEVNDNEFDFGDTTYLCSLNTGLSRSVMQQKIMIGFGRPQNDISNTGIESNIVGQMPCNNYDWSMRNCEMGGPSSVAAHVKSFDLSIDQPAQPCGVNFGRNNIIQQVSYPSQSTDRCNDVVEILTQLTEIVNNNDLVVVQQDASDSDTHSNHGLIEDYHSSDDEDVVNVSNIERELAEEWIQISIESMNAAILGTRLSFAPDYIPPNEYVDPPVVQNRRRERQAVPRDRESCARRAGGGRGGRCQADHHLVDEENAFA
ncbi:hypothetical protein HAX54_038819 [Datura stramonium]|uniref:Uncharacterized protein n=1 Tax=Datura stramonium TaxID=4076 RepID=A0ABS8SIJ3_DATST|nr:hypothetical protein [Datura stramonium]